ncbi:MAG: hypothetical protein BGO48_01990 [Mucilaginibacter sp. 44-25]|nr:MAG: hypothetical protein BGO48_01990 [Mucilaginibacter sp. 44-25]
MSLVLNEKYSKSDNTSFYVNRMLKIYPLYWINLVFLILWGLVVYKLGYPGTIHTYTVSGTLSMGTWVYLILSNIFILGLDFSFLLGLKNGDIHFTSNFQKSNPNVYLLGFNSIAWTISVELIFYLIAPYIVRRKILIPIGLLIISFSIRVILWYSGYKNHPWDYMFFPTQIMFFMAGVISYKIYSKVRHRVFNVYFSSTQYFLLIFLLIFYSYLFTNSYYHQVIFFIFLIVLIPISFVHTSKSKIDRYLGNISYPIYITQALIIGITKAKVFPKPFGFGLTTLIILIITAIFLEYFFEKYISIYRRKVTNKI